MYLSSARIWFCLLGFLVVRTKVAIDAAKEYKEKGKGPCLKELSLVDVPIGRASLLEISSNSSMLAVAIGADIYFFSVPSLLKKVRAFTEIL